jgi:diguanylate cyclase (GGDEF)-like protein
MGIRDSSYARAARMMQLSAVVGLLIIWLTACIFFARDYGATQRTEEDYLFRLTQSATQQVYVRISQIDLCLKILDEWLASHPQADPRGDPQFAELANSLREHSQGFVDIRMIDGSGGLFSLSSPSPGPLADYSGAECFRVQADPLTRGLRLCLPMRSPASGAWGVPISYPLREGRKGITVLFGTIEFAALDAMFKSVISRDDGALTLIRRADGMVLAQTPLAEGAVGKPFRDSAFAAQIGKAPSGKYVSGNKALQGKGRRFMAYQTLPEYGLILTIGQDSRGILRQTISHNLAAFLLLLVGSVAFLALTDRVRRLLKNLNETRERLEKASQEDSLTGLYNRGYFFSRVQEEMGRSDRYGSSLALCVIDIDHFKTINDSYGHPEGDRVIIEIAGILKTGLREGDMVGRFGGDEFCILLAHAEGGAAVQSIERIRRAVESVSLPPLPGSEGAHPTISAGLAIRAPKGLELEPWYAKSDAALYSAKEGGRNRVELADDGTGPELDLAFHHGLEGRP